MRKSKIYGLYSPQVDKVSPHDQPHSLSCAKRHTYHASLVNNIEEVGGVNPNRVEGRVNCPSVELQKQPHPAGQIGTVTSSAFQQDTCVICKQDTHVRAKPTFDVSMESGDKITNRIPLAGRRHTVQIGMEHGVKQY